jgi:hypothetical protein
VNSIASPDRVRELILAGKTVQWITDLTGWPRREVMKLARGDRLLHDPDQDVFRMPPAGEDAAAPPPQPPGRCSHAQLLHWAEVHPSRRIQAAGRRATEAMAWLIDQHDREAETAALRDEIAKLEEQLAAKKAELRGPTPATGAEPKASTRRRSPRPPDYDHREVRAWAKRHGIEIRAKGRYLPKDVVDAWRKTQAGAA